MGRYELEKKVWRSIIDRILVCLLLVLYWRMFVGILYTLICCSSLVILLCCGPVLITYLPILCSRLVTNANIYVVLP